MTLAEKIISLPPVAVTAAFLVLVGISEGLTRLFPLNTAFAPIATVVTGALLVGYVFGWTFALYETTKSRLNGGWQQAPSFGSAVIWGVAWMILIAATVATQRTELFLLAIPINLVATYFYLRSLWITTSALLAFENSRDRTSTLAQIFFFPLGVWFLRPRLRRLVAAPRVTP